MRELGICLLVVGFGAGLVLGFRIHGIQIEAITRLNAKYDVLLFNKYITDERLPLNLRKSYFNLNFALASAFLLASIGALLIGKTTLGFATLALSIISPLLTWRQFKSARLSDASD